MAVYVNNQRPRGAAVMSLPGVIAQRARNMSVLRRLGPLDLRGEDGEILSSSSGTIRWVGTLAWRNLDDQTVGQGINIGTLGR